MLSSLKLQLANEAKIFTPGEQIQGTVSIRGVSSVPLGGLNVQMLGTIHTLQIQGPYSELRESQVVCDEITTIFPESSDERSSRGNNSFRFTLTIPEDIPCSIAINDNNNIKYKLKASLPKVKGIKSAERNIYLVGSSYIGDVNTIKVISKAKVPRDENEILIRYGEGSETLASTFSNVEKDEKSIRSYVQDESVITLDVSFPQPGIYTDDKLNLPTVLYFPGEQPPMILKHLKVVLVEETQIVAKTIGNKEKKHHTLFSLKDKIDVSDAPVHDFTSMIAEQAVIPDLAPDFTRETMSRSYVWHVHAALYKGDLKSDAPPMLIHLNARSTVKIFGRRDNTVLPTFSRTY